MYEDLSENAPLKIVKNEFGEKWRIFFKKLAYPYEFLKRIADFKLPVNNFETEDFFGTLKKTETLTMRK